MNIYQKEIYLLSACLAKGRITDRLDINSTITLPTYFPLRILFGDMCMGSPSTPVTLDTKAMSSLVIIESFGPEIG